MIINNEEERVTVCTLADFIDIISNKICDNDIPRKMFPAKYFPDVDFSFVCEEVTKDSKITELDHEQHFGIKSIKSFDSNELNLMCDFYGGGCFHATTIAEDDRFIDIHNKVMKLVVDTLNDYEGCSPDDMLYVEWFGGFIKNTYEVHEIEDTFTGTPKYCMSCSRYEEALEVYESIVEDKLPARLLLVDKDGMPIYEIKYNY